MEMLEMVAALTPSRTSWTISLMPVVWFLEVYKALSHLLSWLILRANPHGRYSYPHLAYYETEVCRR